MIQREMVAATVNEFSTGTDKYGIKHTSGYDDSKRRQIKIMVKLYTQQLVEDVRYKDITHIGITADKTLTDNCVVSIGADDYKVLYTIPSNRFQQVLMKKV